MERLDLDASNDTMRAMNHIAHRQQLRRKLAQQKKQTLIEVIEHLLEADEGLESIVLACIAELDVVDTFDASPMRSRADGVFAVHEPGWGVSDHIVSALERLQIEASGALNQGRTRAAASTHAGLLLSIAAHQEWQDECELQWLFEECCEVLQKCITAEQDSEVARQMIDVFGSVLESEVLDGGYGLDDLVGPIFLSLAPEDQRHRWVETASARFRFLEHAARKPLKHRRSGLRQWIKRLLVEEDVDAWVAEPDRKAFRLKSDVEACIKRRKRAAYVEACDAMARIQAYYREQGTEGAFAAYISEVKRHHSSLRSLCLLIDDRKW